MEWSYIILDRRTNVRYNGNRKKELVEIKQSDSYNEKGGKNMLYQVKCRKISGEEKGDYIPVPDGIEAQNKKAAIKAAMAIIVNQDSQAGYDSNTEGGRIVSRGENKEIIYFAFSAKLMTEDGTVYNSSDEIAYAFMDTLITKLKEIGYNPEEYSNICVAIGVRVQTGVDTWITDIRESNGETAQIILYHKNNFGSNVDTTSKIPGFHKQCSGRYTLDEIIKVMVDHGNKWKSRRR